MPVSGFAVPAQTVVFTSVRNVRIVNISLCDQDRFKVVVYAIGTGAYLGSNCMLGIRVNDIHNISS